LRQSAINPSDVTILTVPQIQSAVVSEIGKANDTPNFINTTGLNVYLRQGYSTISNVVLYNPTISNQALFDSVLESGTGIDTIDSTNMVFVTIVESVSGLDWKILV